MPDVISNYRFSTNNARKVRVTAYFNYVEVCLAAASDDGSPEWPRLVLKVWFLSGAQMGFSLKKCDDGNSPTSQTFF